jgi:hypothetical protein
VDMRASERELSGVGVKSGNNWDIAIRWLD